MNDMQETPITHPGIPEEQYHRLGKKTFWMFLLERCHAPFVFLIVAAGLFVVAVRGSFVGTPAANLQQYVLPAFYLCLLLFVLTSGFVLLIVWLMYSHYKFSLGDDSLKIKRGVFNQEEVAIPYRQIQDVDISRNLSFQMLGLSRIIILTAGHEDEKAPGDESEGVLPAIDKDLAEWLQAELLKRANVQKVVEEQK